MHKVGDKVWVLHKDAFYDAKITARYLCQATGECLYVVYSNEWGHLIRKDSHVYELQVS